MIESKKYYLYLSIMFFVCFFVLLGLLIFIKPENFYLNSLLNHDYSNQSLFKTISYVLFISNVVFMIFKVIVIIINKKDVFPILISYSVLLFIWIVFDYLFIINYRPTVDEGSFPSTHVLLVSYCSIILINNFKTKTKFSYLILLQVVLICLSRIILRKHWLTDCVGGILVGFGVAYLQLYICSKLKKK